MPKVTQPQVAEDDDSATGAKKTRGARMQMLRKQLEESKARQEAELSSRQDLENIVAGLQRELEERDSMIQNMQLGSVDGSVTSSVLGSPFVMSPDQGSPTDSPGNTTPPAGKHHCTMTELLYCNFCQSRGVLFLSAVWQGFVRLALQCDGVCKVPLCQAVSAIHCSVCQIWANL